MSKRPKGEAKSEPSDDEATSEPKEGIALRVLKVNQPIGEFYIGAIDSRVLNSIATVEVRAFRGNRARDVAGIQRTLSLPRVQEIADYVNFDYATFPTSIVIAVDERCASITPAPNCDGLYDFLISGYEGDDDEPSVRIGESAFIIDGQHRLAGLQNLSQDKTFEVNVSVFVGADMADRAEIFSTVNLAQTKVNRSLVYDLFSYADNPSPFKMAHEIAIALDKDEAGPFHEKIKRLGVATPGRDKETLSQATVVRGILRHMPANPEREKNKGFLGTFAKPEPGESFRTRIFSPFYRRQDSVSIFQILDNYFSAVEDEWPSAWIDPEEGFILNRTNGYNALIRFLQDAYLSLTDEPVVVEKDGFRRIFSSMRIRAAEFTIDRFKPGSSGASELYKLFLTNLQG
jgi:DGQHR domain-containing protein